MSNEHFNVIVIGAGVAGQAIAISAAGEGLSVAMTEGRDYGGTCPLRGCDPKLVLHAAAAAVHRTERLKGKGFTARPAFSWPELMEWKRTFTEPVPAQSKKKMREAGIEVYDGYAKFLDEKTLRFGDGPALTADRIYLTTGMKPAPLSIPGAELMLTSDEFLDMDDLPDSMIVVGGGYIGAETTFLAQSLGCQVTWIVSEDTPLSGFDPDLTDLLRKAAEEIGCKVILNAKATKVTRQEEEFTVEATVEEDGKESQITHQAHRVIHCAGRIPNLEELGLEVAGIAYDESKGIRVDEYLQTNQKNVYAAGDCADSGLPLTPVASFEAGYLNDQRTGERKKIVYPTLPTVAFTSPPIASVGKHEAEVDLRKHNVKFEDATDWFTAHHCNETVYAFKTIVERETNRVVGAHILGPGAVDTVNLFALAIEQKVTCTELRKMIWAYPTASGNAGSMV